MEKDPITEIKEEFRTGIRETLQGKDERRRLSALPAIHDNPKGIREYVGNLLKRKPAP